MILFILAIPLFFSLMILAFVLDEKEEERRRAKEEEEFQKRKKEFEEKYLTKH